MILIGIHGACGRMSKYIAFKILEQDDMAVTDAFDCEESQCLNNDLGHICGIDEWGIPVKPLNQDEMSKMNVLIDFSSREGLCNALTYAKKHNIPFITGTTGLSEQDIQLIGKASAHIPIVYSSNMSIGINQIMRSMELMKDMLNDRNRDIEIIEYHHRLKSDSPSGTALMLASKIEELTGRTIESEIPAAMPRNDAIRIHSIRAGSFSGIHKIIISDTAETIEICHTAHSRETFAEGVIKAIHFIIKQKNGLFNMDNVLKEL